MSESVVSRHFGHDQAASYDERWARMAPIRDGLHLLMRTVLSELPGDARILCVGAGTGAELIALARAFPSWRFTAVDPSGPMLDVCRRKAVEAGVASRCEFHEGYLDSLPHAGPFDAATSVLVSQFLTDPDRRREYFRQIAALLRPGAYLINADLASDFDEVARQSLTEVWLRAHAGAAGPAVKDMCASWGKTVAVSPPREVASLMATSGFEQPVLFYQALFVHAWYAQTRRDQ